MEQSKTSKTSGSLFIRIINDNDIELCPFWIGLFNKGNIIIHEALKSFDVKNILQDITYVGINELDAIMLIDTQSDVARFVYLLPYLKDKSINDIITQMSSTLKNWSAPKLGLYFNPQILSLPEGIEFTYQALLSLIQNSLALEIFLYVGNYGTNNILNIIMKDKESILQNNIKIYIFH
mgnify:CR=1 FL=1